MPSLPSKTSSISKSAPSLRDDQAELGVFFGCQKENLQRILQISSKFSCFVLEQFSKTFPATKRVEAQPAHRMSPGEVYQTANVVAQWRPCVFGRKGEYIFHFCVQNFTSFFL